MLSARRFNYKRIPDLERNHSHCQQHTSPARTRAKETFKGNMGVLWRRLMLQRLRFQQQGASILGSALQGKGRVSVGFAGGEQAGIGCDVKAGGFTECGFPSLNLSAEFLKGTKTFNPLAGPSVQISPIGRDAFSSLKDTRLHHSIGSELYFLARVASDTQPCLNASAQATFQGGSFCMRQSPPQGDILFPKPHLQSPPFRSFHHSPKLQVSQTSSESQVPKPSNPVRADVRRHLAEESVRRASAKSTNMLLYLCALTVAMVGATYSAVPLYRMFCQATGFGGTVQKKETVEEKIARHSSEKKAVPARQITVQFNADVADGMPWKFTPCQREVKIVPGQSTLAFYTAHNLSDKAITGVSTYNVSPMRAGIYFNKIQCFCFEEQRLRPGEKVDMPVFFYIDPEFAEDAKMRGINLLTLSYTFFKVSEDD